MVGPETTIEDSYPEDWLALIKPELAPGERLLWAGQASAKYSEGTGTTGRILAPTVLAIGLGSFYLALGPWGPYLRSVDALILGVGYVATLVALIMAAVMVGRFLGGMMQRRPLKRNLYALTDRRVITWTPQPIGPGVQVRSVGRGAVEKTSRIEYPDGFGDVYFEPNPNPYTALPSITGIPEVRRVEALARRVLIDPDAPK